MFLSSVLFLLLNVVIAVIILEVILWILSAVLEFAVPPKIRKLLYALIVIWALIGLIGILTGGSALYWYPHAALR